MQKNQNSWPALLLASPHRLLFLTGVAQMMMMILWWLFALMDTYTGTGTGAGILIQTDLPPGILHGQIMLFLLLPPFLFGFLLTVFPRWMGYDDFSVRLFSPVGIAFALSGFSVTVGIWSGNTPMIRAAFVLGMIGWAYALILLAGTILRNWRDSKPVCWHAISAWVALTFGLVGAGGTAYFLFTGDGQLIPIVARMGTFAFMVPLFATVMHRMLPFFASMVVADYVRWRPDWLLLALWILLLLYLGADLAQNIPMLAGTSLTLAALFFVMLAKWMPRALAPGLLWALVVGVAWQPIAFLLLSAQAMGFALGRAPLHALYVGFACSLLIAMVTRVTYGHSGRSLSMPAVGWVALIGIQIAAALRIAAGVMGESGYILIAAAAILAIALCPWTIHCAYIYVTRRRDGKAG
ncbi:MAG: NnrS family protein [Pseudomonadota bacterium]